MRSATTGAEKALADEAKSGVFYPTVDGLRKALKFIGVNCRYNTRSHRLQWGPVRGTRSRLRTLDEWGDSTDRLRAAIQNELSLRCKMPSFKKDDPPIPYSLSRDRWPQCLNAILYRREIDPFKEYLNNLVFDGARVGSLSDEMCRELAPRCAAELDEWLGEVFEFADGANDLSRWVSRFLFLGPVQRTMEPGCKLDEMPVLVGPQKLGKSPMIKSLLPPEFGDDGFADNLKLTDHNKQFAERLQGRIVVEVAEMAGAGRAHLDHLKAALSRQDDGGVRLAYRTDPEPMPRRCVMIGTANEACLPNDPTGNRRFAVVELASSTSGIPVRAKVCVEDYLEERRDRFWALAVIAWRGGERANLPTSLAAIQAEANSAYRIADTLAEDIVAQRQNVLVKRFYETGERGLTMQQIAEGLWDERADHMLNQRGMPKRVGTALRMPPDIWTSSQRRVDGKRAVRWFPPPELLERYPRKDARISQKTLDAMEAEAAADAARKLAEAERRGGDFSVSSGCQWAGWQPGNPWHPISHRFTQGSLRVVLGYIFAFWGKTTPCVPDMEMGCHGLPGCQQAVSAATTKPPTGRSVTSVHYPISHPISPPPKHQAAGPASEDRHHFAEAARPAHLPLEPECRFKRHEAAGRAPGGPAPRQGYGFIGLKMRYGVALGHITQPLTGGYSNGIVHCSIACSTVFSTSDTSFIS